MTDFDSTIVFVPHPTIHNFKDMTGQVFGRLTVLGYAGSLGKKPGGWWHVKCDCGTRKTVSGLHLRKGESASCGCLRKEVVSDLSRTHGLTNDPLYPTWQSIKNRVRNKNQTSWKNYGGRGLKMEPDWVNDFVKFRTDILANIGPKPSKNYSLDRKDNDIGYFMFNLRWATDAEQSKNRRITVLLTVSGEEKSIPEWSKLTGTSYGTIHNRLRRGFCHDCAVHNPVGVPCPHR